MLLTSTNSSSPVMFIVILLLLIAAGCWAFFKKRGQQTLSLSEPKAFFPESLKEEFILPILKYFSDNMNNLQNIIKGKTNMDGADITFENIGQIIEAHGSKEFNDWYDSFVKDRNAWDMAQYSRKAKVLLDCFEKCGVQPSDAESIIWNERSSIQYVKVTPVAPGQRCEVIDPMWTYKGKVFEKGIVKVIE